MMMKNRNQRDLVSVSTLNFDSFLSDGLSYVSVNSNCVHPPPPLQGLAQKACPGGRDLAFESCSGAGNSTRTRILWKMKVKLPKNSVGQIFTGQNKKQAEFLTFFEVTCFLNGIFPGLWVNFLVLLSHIPYKKSEELSLACLYLKFSLGNGYPHLLSYKRL